MRLNNRFKLAAIFSVVIIFIVIYNILPDVKNKIITKTTATTCDIQKGVCQLTVNNTKIKVYTAKNIYYLKPFDFLVTVEKNEGFDIDSIYVDFKMNNMNMGVNRFKLQSEDGRLWQGKALLPVCVSGRAEWLAEVDIMAAETQHRFLFPIIVEKTEN